MPQFVIVREMPGAGRLSVEELRGFPSASILRVRSVIDPTTAE